ncbi:ABC transporter ATP-binding protein [Psychromicrobium sp. YIM B11713]|uniref:ABC transporter ATP-binding protein n=1 Tax=Psychromicrobium sp. YIM B11713 TaxID=3145233 RepID=UPI00374F02FD
MSHLSSAETALNERALNETAEPANSADYAIQAHQITKKYGSRLALNGVSFTMPKGTVFGVIGPNGAGKTTTMRTLLDIVRPTSGQATVLGVDPRQAGPELRRRIGFLPGELILDGRSTGRKLLQHYADISGPVSKGYLEELAERLGLDLSRPVRKLSKGNKQKLGIVQAFMHKPDLLVLDEPTSGLDPLMQQVFLELVAEARQAGQSVFLSSHVISEIQQAADEVAILRDGKIVTISSVEELRASAIRHLKLVTTGISSDELRQRLEALEGVGNISVHSNANDVEAKATLIGAVQPVIQAISTLPLRDLVLEEPDLEESVLKLYSSDSKETVR